MQTTYHLVVPAEPAATATATETETETETQTATAIAIATFCSNAARV
jgi:hypothetical protein